MDPISSMLEGLRVANNVDHNNNLLRSQVPDVPAENATNSQEMDAVDDDEIQFIAEFPDEDSSSESGMDQQNAYNSGVEDEDVIFVKKVEQAGGHAVKNQCSREQHLTSFFQALRQKKVQKPAPPVITLDLDENVDSGYYDSSPNVITLDQDEDLRQDSPPQLLPPLFQLDSQELPEVVLNNDLTSYFRDEDSKDIADTYSGLFEVYGVQDGDSFETAAMVSLFELV